MSNKKDWDVASNKEKNWFEFTPKKQNTPKTEIPVLLKTNKDLSWFAPPLPSSYLSVVLILFLSFYLGYSLLFPLGEFTIAKLFF